MKKENKTTSIIDLIFDLISIIFRALGDFIEFLLNDTQSHTKNATFIDEGDVLKTRHKGFNLTGTKSLSVKDSYTNAMIIGGTGTGKSSISLISTLHSIDGSIIVHDPSGELFDKSSGNLEKRGYKVKVLNFSDPRNSIGYNPLERANTTSEINKVADLLIRATLGDKSSNPFWDLQARELLSMLIRIIKTQDEECQNLVNVRQLLFTLASQPAQVDSLFAKYADEELLNQYKAFIAYDSKITSGIIATVQSAMQLFSDGNIARVTSYDSLDLNSFRTERTALFIQNSVSEMKYFSPLVNILMEQLFTSTMRNIPKATDENIFFLIDECSSLKMPSLAITIANIRKYKAGLFLVLQDENQLIENYGREDAQTIKTNCMAKMYFTGQGLRTSQELSQLLGKYTYTDERGQERLRELMTADEIRTMDKKYALVIISNLKPMKVKLTPYYKNRKLKRLSALKPAETKTSFYMHQIPLLDLMETI